MFTDPWTELLEVFFNGWRWAQRFLHDLNQSLCRKINDDMTMTCLIWGFLGLGTRRVQDPSCADYGKGVLK